MKLDVLVHRLYHSVEFLQLHDDDDDNERKKLQNKMVKTITGTNSSILYFAPNSKSLYIFATAFIQKINTTFCTV